VRADTIYKTVRKYWAERIKVAMCKFRAECGYFGRHRRCRPKRRSTSG